MHLLEALILGIIQGLTEFFPISSSGHLLIVPELLAAAGLDLDFSFQNLSFDISLHIATFFAIAVTYRHEIYNLVTRVRDDGKERRLALRLIVANVPALTAGFVLMLYGDQILSTELATSIFLIVFGIGLIVAEIVYLRRANHKSAVDLSLGSTLGIGVFQSFALLRGVSRSGSTIIAAIIAGLSKREALDFAFLLGLPLFAMLALAQTAQFIINPDSTASVAELTVGFVAAFITGLVVIKLFRNFIRIPGILIAFGIYRIIIGIIVIITN